MSAFRDAVTSDVSMTFLNLEEFADWHDIDGASVRAVITSDTEVLEQGAQSGGFMDAQTLGLMSNRIHVYCSSGDIRTPLPDQRVEVDGVDYTVDDVSDEMGMLSIGLSRAFS